MLLIVDDDPTFLEKAQAVLDVGRGLFFAGSAEHAKELMSTVGAAFSLVMIDLDLPGQDGFSFIMEMRENFPDLPVIAISGVFERPRAGECHGYGRSRHTTKAYRRSMERSNSACARSSCTRLALLRDLALDCEHLTFVDSTVPAVSI